MRVFVLGKGEYSDFHVVGVFASEDDAWRHAVLDAHRIANARFETALITERKRRASLWSRRRLDVPKRASISRKALQELDVEWYIGPYDVDEFELVDVPPQWCAL